jgi:hypothetical protein
MCQTFDAINVKNIQNNQTEPEWRLRRTERGCMFASHIGTKPKCVARLPSLLKVVLVSKSIINNLFLSLGYSVR